MTSPRVAGREKRDRERETRRLAAELAAGKQLAIYS